MKGFLITHKGMEDIAALEVKELIGKQTEIKEKCVVFDISSYEDLFKLCYMSQSASAIYYLLYEFDSNFLVNLAKNIENIDLSEWLSKKTTFKVKCKKDIGYEESTSEIESKAGKIIISHIQKKYGYKQKVSLENPDVIIIAYLVGKKCYMGIDFAGLDLSKRSYKIFTDPSSLKGTIAYSLVRLSKYKKKDSLLDCFASSGVIPIESALFASKLPINFFNKDKFTFLKLEKFKDYNFKGFFEKIDGQIDEDRLNVYSVDPLMKYIQHAKKNSKIAGIDKKINFSRIDLEWLDTKFKKNSIGRIVTKLPISQKTNLDETYNEFFYQAEFILTENGKIVVVGDKALIEKYSAKYGFYISENRQISSGDKVYEILMLES